MKEDAMDKLPREITENGITYTLHGEYYLPNIVLSSDDKRPIGRWGRMHKKYLLENRPVIYNEIVIPSKCPRTGTCYSCPLGV